MWFQEEAEKIKAPTAEDILRNARSHLYVSVQHIECYGHYDSNPPPSIFFLFMDSFSNVLPNSRMDWRGRNTPTSGVTVTFSSSWRPTAFS
jgi:hypothetical protein